MSPRHCRVPQGSTATTRQLVAHMAAAKDPRAAASALHERLLRPSCHAVFTRLWHNGHMAPLSNVDPQTSPPAEQKSAWRSSVRRSRLQRGEKRNAEHAETLRDLVVALPEFEGVKCASVYVSRSFEPGTLPLIEAMLERGIEVLLPRLGDGLQRGWSVYSQADDLVARSPGRPPEPSGDFLPQNRLADADIIVVPALAADTKGTRLGGGAGWYDRALVDARPGVPIVALLFDDEFHDADEQPIPREWHDVPVMIVVRPSGVDRIGG